MKVREGENRHTEIKWVLRDPCNAGFRSNVACVLIKIAQLGVTAVVIEGQIVREAIATYNPSCACIDARRIGRPEQCWKWVRYLALRITVVEIEIDVAACPTASATTSTASLRASHRHKGRAFTEIVN